MDPAARSTPALQVVTRLKAACFVVALLPVARLVYGAIADTLGANPIEFIIRDLGTWALTFLLITLAVTPLRRLSNLAWLLRFRRMLGLFAFFYAVLHVLCYVGWDQAF
ncbi:MAG: ferric reductase-like transmembrane domain-containing protein, partial [Casimicrobiaceae bacterium]